VVVDLRFGSYPKCPKEALRFLHPNHEGKCGHAVKVEGGQEKSRMVKRILKMRHTGHQGQFGP